jgi:hypothetical protein
MVAGKRIQVKQGYRPEMINLGLKSEKTGLTNIHLRALNGGFRP